MSLLFIVLFIFLMPMILGIIFGLFAEALPIVALAVVLIILFGVEATILLFFGLIIFSYLTKGEYNEHRKSN